MIFPREWTEKLVDKLCVEGEQHRRFLAGVTAICFLVLALAPPGGFSSLSAMGSGTIAGSWSGIGYISKWRGWTA